MTIKDADLTGPTTTGGPRAVHAIWLRGIHSIRPRDGLDIRTDHASQDAISASGTMTEYGKYYLVGCSTP